MVNCMEWIRTGDGFAMCAMPLADILEGMGIHDTGLSAANPADVQSYYDDWYLYSVTGEKTVYGLVKMREQEYDFVPGYSDRDDPGITVSFIPFDFSLPERLKEDRNSALPDFVAEFRRVTELPGQHHDPILQKYFSDPSAQAPYTIAECYLKKLLQGAVDGRIPLPNRMRTAPKRVLAHIEKLNSAAGRTVCDLQNGYISVLDPTHPTAEEEYCLLITHTGDPDFNSFAAEVEFHAAALVSPMGRIPVLGKTKWYASAIRADMQLETDGWFRSTFFSPYFDRRSRIVRRQAKIHGKK